MPDASKPPSWIAMIGGTVMGLLTGSLTMYTWLEHRIESRVEAKVMIEVRISAIEAALKTNKDAAWLADENLVKRLDIQQERITQLSSKVDGLHLPTVTPVTTPAP